MSSSHCSIMDLPPHYEDRFASQRIQFSTSVSATNDATPAYGSMRLQTFVVTHGFFDSDYKVFTSPNALAEYRKYKHLAPGGENFPVAKKQQNLSIGLPLLVSHKASGYTSTYIRLFSTAPAPDASDRLYDPNEDNRLIGKVCNIRFRKYVYYKFDAQGTKVTVLEHQELPIIDFQVGCNRFRFVRQSISEYRVGDFQYMLYLLSPDQMSLFDGLNSTGYISKSNMLLDKDFLKTFTNSKDQGVHQFESLHPMGALEHSPSSERFASFKEVSIFTTFTSAENLDSNHEVEPQTLAFMAVVLVVQRIEDMRAMNRGSSNRACVNNVNNFSMVNTMM